MAYRIGIKNRAGTRMAIFTEVTDPETQQRQLTVVFQHPSVDAEALARMRRLAERTWRQGRDSGGSRPRNESPAT